MKWAPMVLALLLPGCSGTAGNDDPEVEGESWGCSGMMRSTLVPEPTSPYLRSDRLESTYKVRATQGDQAIDFLLLRGSGRALAGEIGFLATGPRGDLPFTGTGDPNDKWEVFLVAPEPGEYTWGIQPVETSLVDQMRLEMTDQKGTPDDFRCSSATWFG